MDKKTEKMLKEHWKILLAAIIAGVIAIIGAIIVLIWVIQTSDIGLQGTATIGQWNMAGVLGFIITLILWELLFIGLPAGIIFGIGGYLWWNNLTAKQKREFKKEDKKHKNGSDGFEFFINIAYIIYIAIDGKFYTPFGDLPYSYWIYAYLLTIMWVAILIGIPMAIAGLVYFKGLHKAKKK